MGTGGHGFILLPSALFGLCDNYSVVNVRTPTSSEFLPRILAWLPKSSCSQHRRDLLRIEPKSISLGLQSRWFRVRNHAQPQVLASIKLRVP